VVEVAGEAVAAGVAEAGVEAEALAIAIVDHQDGVLVVVRKVTLSSNGQHSLKTEPLPPSLWVEGVLLTPILMEDMGPDHPVLEVHILLETPHTATGLQVMEPVLVQDFPVVLEPMEGRVSHGNVLDLEWGLDSWAVL